MVEQQLFSLDIRMLSHDVSFCILNKVEQLMQLSIKIATSDRYKIDIIILCNKNLGV